MTRITVECYLPIVIFILCPSKILWNDGMGWNWGVFGVGEKKLILRCLSFLHHSVIPSSFRNSNTNWAQDCPWNDVRMTQEWPRNERIRWCILKETASDSFILTSQKRWHGMIFKTTLVLIRILLCNAYKQIAQWC